MKAIVIQHDHVSPPGPVGERLTDRGFELTCHELVPEESYHAPGVDYSVPALTDFDLVVAMGAPWSSYDHELIGSWVLPELDALRAADAAGVPVLGICFGGQLLASAHGGRVEHAPAAELGWRPVVSDDDGLVPGGAWFQWHYDRWTPPPGASEIARNEAASQAFVLRRNLAVQFHPELTSAMLTGWLDAGGAASLEGAGVDPTALLVETRRRDAESRLRAHRLVDQFLKRVARS